LSGKARPDHSVVNAPKVERSDPVWVANGLESLKGVQQYVPYGILTIEAGS